MYTQDMPNEQDGDPNTESVPYTQTYWLPVIDEVIFEEPGWRSQDISGTLKGEVTGHGGSYPLRHAAI